MRGGPAGDAETQSRLRVKLRRARGKAARVEESGKGEEEVSGIPIPPVLDACCGARMFWFDRADKRAVFMDVREGEWSKDYGTEKTAGRSPVVVSPDVIGDFSRMPFPDESFNLVVFDPPHHTSKHFGNGDSIIKSSYGVLLAGWEEMLSAGFVECFRVLKPNGTLIFKWGSREIPLKRVLALTSERPLFGHTTGAKAHTHWVTFMKQGRNAHGR